MTARANYGRVKGAPRVSARGSYDLTTLPNGRVLDNVRRRKKSAAQTESQILAGIMDWLKWNGVLAWRNNTGAVRAKHGDSPERFVRFGVVGSADIFGLIEREPYVGRFIGIEVKRPGLGLTDKQEAWAKMIRGAGGIVILAHSIDELALCLAAELARPAGVVR